MDTGVCDLQVAFFKANSTCFMTYVANRPIYPELNTHTLAMILQLKYMPIAIVGDNMQRTILTRSCIKASHLMIV